MFKGFDFFKTRQDSLLETIETLEKANNASLPPAGARFQSRAVIGRVPPERYGTKANTEFSQIL